MKANKIMLNGETILDLTEDTVEEQDVSVGKTFHKADGTEAVGTATGNGVSSYNDLSNKPSIVLAVNEAGTLFVTTIHDYEKKQKAFVEYSKEEDENGLVINQAVNATAKNNELEVK